MKLLFAYNCQIKTTCQTAQKHCSQSTLHKSHSTVLKLGMYSLHSLHSALTHTMSVADMH